MIALGTDIYKHECCRAIYQSSLRRAQVNMAPLKIIGAGYGRTGTLSLCAALDILGWV
jgi:hypothetical protein